MTTVTHPLPVPCPHANTTVVNSRPAGSIRTDGGRWNKPRDYPCLVFRRRKCLDCGDKINTVEVRTDYMDDLFVANDPSAMRKSIAEEVFTYLTKGVA